MKFILVKFSLLFVSSIFAQQKIDFNKNRLTINNRIEGVVLEDTLSLKYSNIVSKSQYIPTKTNVVFFENKLLNSVIKNQNPFFSRRKSFLRKSVFFKKFKRQYSGYINKDNDTIIIVNMLSFENRKKAEQYFENWETQNFNFYSNSFFYKEKQQEFTLKLNLSIKDTITIMSVSDIPKSNLLDKTR